jgi:ribosomal protein S18 acetylase RimI-like enzyme
MIEIRIIDSAHARDINIPNQPFDLFGRMIPAYTDRVWSYTVLKFDKVTSMCFPDENYDYDALTENSIFVGAYDNGKCVGLAILQKAFFKYMYLYDLKLDKEYRGTGVGRKLMEKCREIALQGGYRGIYTIGQDNNLGACLFYIKCGFHIGGCDTEVYKGTNQEGKTDIYFYWDCQ